MAKPVLLSVDDDPDVLRAIERDLRRQYADRYRVLHADSGESALETLRQLKTRNDPVALLLADQRMPQMDGVRFLTEALKLYPEAKRALLTAYADTDAAIRAINEVKIHHYLLKPWDPPEEQLYPVIDDLLDDWSSSYRPRSKAYACWATDGRRNLTRSANSWRAIRFHTTGWISSQPMRKPAS